MSVVLLATFLSSSFGNGASEVRSYDPTRGWLDVIDIYDSSLTRLDRTRYTRSASGRVSRQRTKRIEGRFDYAYDYSGRLLSAVNWGGALGYDQTFTYDTAGSMRSNSALGTYDYGATNAAHPHAPNAVGLDQFTYDLNGNMTTGLGGKVMIYDAENRPLSVSHNGTTTSYVYGPDGTRLKKVEGSDTTVYFGPVEIRKFGQGAASEEIILYPHPNVRLVNGVASYLHTDQLGSVRVITGDTGASAKETVYRPFGEAVDFITDPTQTFETKGFIGERYDTDAGLQYLNARYYDPALHLFTQPDWFEVTMAGVGTNRYSYSFNDPVNLRDPNGNATVSDSAHMSADVYKSDDADQAEDFPDHIHRLSAEERKKMFGDDAVWQDPNTSFRARAYRNTKTGEITIAFAGTKDLIDWGNNVVQGATGSSSQYEQAVALAQTVSKSSSVPSRREGLSFTGHSLGGGLAMESALSFQGRGRRYAHVFNAAGITPAISEILSHIYDGLAGKNANLHNHVIGVNRRMLTGPDPLTTLNRATPGMYVPGDTTIYPSNSHNPMYNHRMEAFSGQISGF